MQSISQKQDSTKSESESGFPIPPGNDSEESGEIHKSSRAMRFKRSNKTVVLQAFQACGECCGLQWTAIADRALSIFHDDETHGQRRWCQVLAKGE